MRHHADLELLDRAGGGAVDTVQKLTDILVAHQARLVDQGGGAGDVIDIDTLDEDLVLDGLGLDGLGSANHVDDTDDLLAQEVLDLDTLATVGDVASDREMRVDETQVVTVSLGHTGDHVGNMGAHRSQGGNLLGETEVQGDFELLSAINLGDRHRKVLEVALEGSLLTLDDDLAALHGHLDSLRDDDGLLGADVLHLVLLFLLHLGS